MIMTCTYDLGVYQLFQLQKELSKQSEMGGSCPENVDSHIRHNQETFILNSLWKINVADIEVTLARVCQMVSS